MAGKAEAISMPTMMAVTSTQNSGRKGSATDRGSTPNIDTHITGLRPMRSPTGPPMKVPSATAPRNTNRWIWALCTEMAKRSIRKKV